MTWVIVVAVVLFILVLAATILEIARHNIRMMSSIEQEIMDVNQTICQTLQHFTEAQSHLGALDFIHRVNEGLRCGNTYPRAIYEMVATLSKQHQIPLTEPLSQIIKQVH